MAVPNKRRAASPRERAASPPTKKHNEKPAGHANGETPAQERYSVYRTLKIMQLLLEGCSKFLFTHSQDFDEFTSREARKLHGEIARHAPIVQAAIDRWEKNPSLLNEVNGLKGGAA